MAVRCLIYLLLLPAFSFGEERYYGTRATAVELTGTPTQSDLQLIPIHTGDVITPDNVRASIQALYDTHRYHNIEVDAEPSGTGTALTFRVQPYFFFSTFRLEPSNLLDRSISGFVRLPHGDRFSQTTVDRIVDDTTNLLKTEGYFDATVSADVRFNELTRLATVTLKAHTQGKARVGTVNIKGGEETVPDRSKLYSGFGLKQGDEFSSDKFEKGLRKIRENFSNLKVGGFLNTQVDTQKDYDESTNTINFVMTVQPGKFTLVEVIGFHISQKKLKELVPVYEEGSVDSDLVEEGRNRLRAYLQQLGYFDVDVQAEIIEATLDNAIQINYRIDKGEQHRIEDVDIRGNHYFTEKDIKARMKVHSAGVFNRGVFSPELLDEDRKSILTMYRNAGFESATVDGHFTEEDHSLVITISIVEGERLLIERLEFVGNRQVPQEELLERTGLSQGNIYTPVAVEKARNALNSMYFAKGFPDASVEQVTDHNSGVTVTFRITEGERYTIGKILVSGNVLTAEKIIHRNANLYPETPYNPEAILDSQQRLYATGLFDRVDIVPLQQDIPGIRNVLIQVEDAKRILFAYGFGYQQEERARFTVELTHSNLFGLDRAITMRLRGGRFEQRIQGTYREPRLFNHDLDGYLSLFYERANWPFFKATRRDLSVQALKKYRGLQTLVYAYSYQTVDLQDIRVNPHFEEFPDEKGIVHIGRLSASYVRDHRDDPINPTKGTFDTSTFQVALKQLGGDVNFTSIYNQAIFYRPVDKASVFATSIRAGWYKPFGGSIKVPITERYFAGGSNSLRGYKLDEAGPAGGGNAMVIVNMEYRTPLNFMPIKNVAGVLFYDLGDVFAEISDITPKNFSHILGSGLRYNTPVGPVRFDVGFNLRQGSADALPQKLVHFYFTLGHAF